jgi:hypothetical protein
MDEKAQLDARLARLRAFIGGETFSALDGLQRDLMQRQAAYMAAYSQTLGERIDTFAKD